MTKLSSLVGMFGLLGLAACASVEDNPAGGVAYDANAAEAHCQQFGRHASIKGVVNSTGELSFACVAGGGPVAGNAMYPNFAEDRCRAQRWKHATIEWAGQGIEYVAYSCHGGAPEAPRLLKK